MSFDLVSNSTVTDEKELLGQFYLSFGDSFNDDEKTLFSKAWSFLCSKTASLMRNCGKPSYLHPMRVAAILAQSKMDMDCIVCGLLHSIFELEGISKEEVESNFGSVITKIVSDTSKITGMKINATSIQQADNIRKMLFAMIDDVRVILVKLADRLDRMRNLKSIEEKAFLKSSLIEIPLTR